MTLIKVPKSYALEDAPSQLIKFYRENPVIAAQHLLRRDGEPLNLAPIQAIVLEEWWNSKFSILTATRGFGKFHDLNTKILTPTGWIKMKDIKVGDKVITPTGSEASVIKLHPQGKQDIYKISFQDGRTAYAGLPHLWKCIGVGGYGSKPTEWQLRTTEEIKDFLENKAKKQYQSVRIALVEDTFITEKDKKLPIHPYVLGALIGDGGISTKYLKITSADSFLVEKVQQLSGYNLIRCVGKDIEYRFLNPKELLSNLQILGLLGKRSWEKYIPEEYMNLSRKQTLELLQGLLDTDGSAEKSRGRSGISREVANNVSFCSTSLTLIKQVQQLIWKLGGCCYLRTKYPQFSYKGEKKKGRVAYNLTIRFKNKRELFSLPRKLDRLTAGDQYSENLGLKIISIEKHSHEEGQCITLDDPEGLYVIDDYVVTHNSFEASVFLALQSILYPGKKSGIFAPAFRQAKLLFKEFEKLYNESPILNECVSRAPSYLNDHCICEFKSPYKGRQGSFIKALPVGNTGGKIRGERFQCFSYDTLVNTNLGILQLGDLVENYKNKKVFVEGSNGFTEVTKFLKNPVEDLYEVVFESSRVLTMTKDQKLLVKRNKVGLGGLIDTGHVLVELSNIDPTTDVVPIFSFTEQLSDVLPYLEPTVSTDLKFSHRRCMPNLEGVFLDERISELLGFIVAEGACNDPSRIWLAQKEPYLIQYFNKVFEDYFHKTPNIKKKFKKIEGKVFEWYSSDICNKVIRNVFLNWGLLHTKSNEKCIPFGVLKSRKSVLSAFLRGLYEGDGGIFIPKIKNSHPFIHYKTVSRKLAVQLKTVLSCFGIDCRINEVHPTNLKHQLQYNVVIATRESVSKFIENIGFISQEKVSKCERASALFESSSTFKPKTRKSDDFYDQIVSIKRVARDYTYDIQVAAEDHLFKVDGLLVHNCIIIDELAQLPSEIFRSAIQPMLSTSSNPMKRVKQIEEAKKILGDEYTEDLFTSSNGYIGLTSGFYQFNYWWSQICAFHAQIQSGNKNYNLRFVPYTELPPGFLELDIIKDARENAPFHVFVTEWLAGWVADSAGAFPMSLLESVRDSSILPKIRRDLNTDKGKEFVFGIDVARDRDSTAIAVIELGYPSKLVHLVELEQTTFPQQAKIIFQLVDAFNPTMIYMDEFGGGKSLKDQLANPEGVGFPNSAKIVAHDENLNFSGKRILKTCVPNSDFIEDSNNNAKTLLEQKMIRLPDSTHPIETSQKTEKGLKEVDLVQEMINQIASVVVTSTPGGRLHYDLPKAKSTSLYNVRKKDLYSAFILACKCAYDLQWLPKKDRMLVEQGVIKEISPVTGSLTQNSNNIILPSDRLAGTISNVEQVSGSGRKTIIPGGGVILSKNVRKR